MADKKQKILIVDDSEMNRDILAVMLGSDYEILEAENGLEAIEILQQGMTDIDLILLDIMMPEMDGFDVLGFMKRSHMTEVIPVIMISSESSSSYIEKAYEMGAADYISRPFNALIVGRRVINTLMLYAKQKRLVQMVADQVYERGKKQRYDGQYFKSYRRVQKWRERTACAPYPYDDRDTFAAFAKEDHKVSDHTGRYCPYSNGISSS